MILYTFLTVNIFQTLPNLMWHSLVHFSKFTFNLCPGVFSLGVIPVAPFFRSQP